MLLEKKQDEATVTEGKSAVVWGGRWGQGIFQSDGKVPHLECGGNYTGVYIYQNSSSHTLHMGVFYGT